jgi:hypothetical protein
MSRQDATIEGEGGNQAREVASLPAQDSPPAWRRPDTPAPVESGTPRAADDRASEHYASHIAETSSSAFMYFCMAGVFRQADAQAYKIFRDRLLADCGAPADPVEVMLIEQLALAHLNTGRLHFKSATAEDLESARTYGALAIALAGEVRRTALAIRAYRVKPQAATGGAGLPASVDPAEPGGEAAEEGGDGEMGSKPGDEAHGKGTIPLPESAEGRGRPEEPRQTTRAQRRRA